MASPADSRTIIEAVESSIEELCEVFKATPTLFYTENDIVCCFYHLFQASFTDAQK